MATEYYIGLMSGTSLDGIDAGLYDFSKKQARVINFYYQPYSQKIKQKIHALSNTYHAISLSDFGELDSLLGTLYAEACMRAQ
jgi:anhydro-N-acetylmuramic acid kinase